jgi:glycosyltransferase involved in cell wall biosynthesis
MPNISVIVTAHNEGEELRRTLRSVVENTHGLREVIVVDDGSDDGSCDNVSTHLIRVIRHSKRIGVASSRGEGSLLAQGDVLCYLDGHHRLSKGCLDHCARLAIDRSAITCPDIKDYGAIGWRLHGAEFRLCPRHRYFSGEWRKCISWRRVTRITGLRAPPYLIPRVLYPRVAWSSALRGWGASEASIAVKAFFTGIPILHLTGPLARHRFRQRFPYETTWDGIWRNQAIIARICFDDATWFQYWLRNVFAHHLTDDAMNAIESSEVQAEHEEFLGRKVRTDREFWTGLLSLSPPHGI